MGSTGEKLRIFNPGDREASAKSMKASRVEDLRNWPPTIMGIPVFPAEVLPTPELAAALADSIESSDELSAIDFMWHDIASGLDTSMPEGTPFMPSFIFDPTFAIDLNVFLNLMVDIGIPEVDVPNFVITNLAKIGEPITKLAACDFKGFAEGIAALDPGIDEKEAKSKAEALGCPPFEIPSLDLSFPPSFSFPNFSLNITPIELVLPQINFDFPQLHISIGMIIQEIVSAILELLSIAINLALKIIEGIVAFILFIIEFILDIIIAIIMEIFAALMKFIGFVAAIGTLIAKTLRFVVVLIVGHLIGAGLIATAVHAEVSS